MIRPLVRFVTPVTAVVLVSVAGCAHHGGPRTSFRLAFPPCCDQPNAQRASAYAPYDARALPPGAVIVGSPSAPLPAPPNGVPPGTPPAVGSWQPGPNGVQPHVAETRPIPVPSPSTSPSPSLDRDGAKLLPPDPDNARLKPPQGADSVKPATADKPEASEFPADIPQFSPVQDQVASGLRPFPGGFEWLKSRGYKTVLYLRTPGEDDAADRTEVERLGMKYLSLEVGPRTLTAELVKEFGKLVQDKDAQPFFVYDRKGMQAGALWYLHFRLTDHTPEPQARAKAVRLGLKEDTTGEHADLWLAINQILRGI